MSEIFVCPDPLPRPLWGDKPQSAPSPACGRGLGRGLLLITANTGETQ
jgi:hypothetical protein